MKKKFKIGYAPVAGRKDKATTFGFKHRGLKSPEGLMKVLLKYSTIPVKLKNGWRAYENVEKIFGWMRVDCDAPGEWLTVKKHLDDMGLMYFQVPSTNYDEKRKNYKWHFHVPVRGVSDDVAKYKWQAQWWLRKVGLAGKLSDERMTLVCVQNANPYKDGQAVEEGLKLAHFVDGKVMKVEQAPDGVVYKSMSKVHFEGTGSDEPIDLKVARQYGSLYVLSPESGIVVDGVGWVRVGDLELEPGEAMGGLSCPGQNSEHSGGCCQPGYAVANVNERGELWIKCTGAHCKDRMYLVDDGIPVGKGLYHDTRALRAYVNNSFYHAVSGMFTWVSSSGVVREFRKGEALTYWKDIELFADDVASELELGMTGNVGQWLQASPMMRKEIVLFNEAGVRILRDLGVEEHEYGELVMREGELNMGFLRKKLAAYSAGRIDECLKYVMREHQVKTLEFNTDPFGGNGMRFYKSLGMASINRSDVFGGRVPERVEWPEALREYLGHFPQFYELLDFIVAARMGGDTKSAYLWMRLPSNWGKTWLFEGVLGDWGCTISESELKKALKGEPSGIGVEKLAGAMFLFIDEFRSPVAELKNIGYKMSVSPKGKMKAEVSVYAKIFASAEEVESLMSDHGIEDQFRNRFMRMDDVGETLLTDLPTYRTSRARFTAAIKWEAYRYMRKLVDEYVAESDKLAASERADAVIAAMREKYAIQAPLLEDAIDDKVDAFAEEIDMMLADNPKFTWCGRNRRNEVFIRDITMAKEYFLQNYLAKTDQARFKHKAPNTLFKMRRGKHKLDSGKRINVYYFD